MDKKIELYTNFYIHNWKKLKEADRIKALEQLEKAYANQQGRKPCPIYWDDEHKIIDEFSEGHYENGVIFLDKDLLKDENVYALIYVTVREGVHAWMDKNPESLPKDWNKEIIRKNLRAYLHRSINDIDYYLQPVEWYANRYAYKQSRKIYDELSARGLDDPDFNKFIQEKIIEHKFNLANAKKKYGKNPELHVQKKIDFKYNLLYGFHNFDKGIKAPRLARLLDDDIERYINDVYFNNEEITFSNFFHYMENNVFKGKYPSWREYLNEKEQKRFLRNENQKSLDEKKGENIEIKEKRRNLKRIYEIDDALER